MADLIQTRRDTYDNWYNVNPILANGEVGIITHASGSGNATPLNPLQCKVGDGSTNWRNLATQAWSEPGLSGSINQRIDEVSGSLHTEVNLMSGSLESLEDNIGHYTCITAGGTAAKVVSAADAPNYTRITGGSLKIKFNSKNTAASGVTLKVGNAAAANLYYDGAPVTNLNTWEAGETVDVYFDGQYYMANNVSGGGTFATGQKVKNVGIDDEPTVGSNNLVKSGGVQNELALGAVYDVSAKNPTAGPNNDGKWESFSALLSDANLSTLIPTSVRKGGMSIKFVQSSDNKYVQYRLMTNSWSIDVANWQGVDSEAITDSKNLIESGAVKIVQNTLYGSKGLFTIHGFIDSVYGIVNNNDRYRCTEFIPITKDIPIVINVGTSVGGACSLMFYDEKKQAILASAVQGSANVSVGIEDIPTNAYYIRSTSLASALSDNTLIQVGTIAGFANIFKKEIIENKKISGGKELFTINGKYINQYGLESDSSTFRCTSFIPISGGDIKVVLGGSTQGAQLLYFYDKDKAPISGTGGGSEVTIFAADIPSKAKYIRLSCTNYSYNNYDIFINVGTVASMAQIVQEETYQYRNLYDSFNKTTKIIEFNDWALNNVTKTGNVIMATYNGSTYPDLRKTIAFNSNKKYYIYFDADVTEIHENGFNWTFNGLTWYQKRAKLGQNTLFFNVEKSSGGSVLSYLQMTPINAQANDQVYKATVNYFSIVECPLDVSLTEDDVKDGTTYPLLFPKYINTIALRNKWYVLGDSLTAQATYIPKTKNVLNIREHVNLGVGGKRASGSDGMWKSEYLLQIGNDADLITIMCGTNDWVQSAEIGNIDSDDTDTYCGALNSIIEYISTNYPTSRFVIMCPPIGICPSYQGWVSPYVKNPRGDSMADFAEAAYQVASAKGIPCARIGQMVGWNQYNIATYINYDGAYLHPNQAGGERIADVLIGFLKTLYN